MQFNINYSDPNPLSNGIYKTDFFNERNLFKIQDRKNPDKNLNTSCHFWTTGVTQNCSAETWTTQLEARMAWRKVEVKCE